MTALALDRVAPKVYFPGIGDLILHGFDRAKAFPNVLRMAMADAAEKKFLDHLSTKTAYTPAANFLALTTVAVVHTDTGTSITEATYTGYARKVITASSDWNAASGGNPATITTAVSETFGACTAGTSTIIGWALITTTSGAGDILQYGTATSTVISTTQTPPVIAAAGVSISLT